MKVKVNEASGATLDWMVSAIKENSKPFPIWIDGKPQCLATYSTDWSVGGPIIEREEIGVERRLPCMKGEEWEASGSISAKGAGYRHAYGPTPLIAAMRCYVASKLGNEVEVPDGLH